MYRLRLYVSGASGPSHRAVANLRELCSRELAGRSQVEVVDVIENPALADEDKILATPTLVRRLPLPVRKIIGDLSDRERVFQGLDLPVASAPARENEQ